MRVVVVVMVRKGIISMSCKDALGLSRMEHL